MDFGQVFSEKKKFFNVLVINAGEKAKKETLIKIGAIVQNVDTVFSARLTATFITCVN